jgi:hypothetical protein
MMDFSSERPDLKTIICNGVIDTSTIEYKQFRVKVEEIIKKNIEETGFDPRENGPPDHIKNQ